MHLAEVQATQAQNTKNKMLMPIGTPGGMEPAGACIASDRARVRRSGRGGAQVAQTQESPHRAGFRVRASLRRPVPVRQVAETFTKRSAAVSVALPPTRVRV